MKTVFALFSLIAVGLAAEIGVQNGLPPFSEGLVPLTDGRSRAVRYYISTFRADAFTADLYCRQSGRQLVSIETDTEQRELERFMEVNQVKSFPWISGTDISQEGVWFWGTGERILYNNFVSGEVDSTNANCLMIAGIDDLARKFQWPKENCLESYTFICES